MSYLSLTAKTSPLFFFPYVELLPKSPPQYSNPLDLTSKGSVSVVIGNSLDRAVLPSSSFPPTPHVMVAKLAVLNTDQVETRLGCAKFTYQNSMVVGFFKLSVNDEKLKDRECHSVAFFLLLLCICTAGH